MNWNNDCFRYGLLVGGGVWRTPTKLSIYQGATHNPNDIGIEKVFRNALQKDLPDTFVNGQVDFTSVLNEVSDKDCFWQGFFHAKKRSTFVNGVYNDIAVVGYYTHEQIPLVLSYLFTLGIDEVFITPNRSRQWTEMPLLLVIDHQEMVDTFVNTFSLKKDYLKFKSKVFV